MVPIIKLKYFLSEEWVNYSLSKRVCKKLKEADFYVIFTDRFHSLKRWTGIKTRIKYFFEGKNRLLTLFDLIGLQSVNLLLKENNLVFIELVLSAFELI